MADNAERVCSGTSDPEVRLRQMLADPVVRAVMACDGVSPGEVERLVAEARRQRRRAPLETRLQARRSATGQGKELPAPADAVPR